jgi:hypothetical protein
VIDVIENLVVDTARKQGVKPTAEIMREVVVTLCGATMTSSGLIHLPGKGVLSASDLVRGLRSLKPEAFLPIEADADQPKENPPAGANLTEFMRQQIEATRRKRALPDDWSQTRAKFAPDTLTAKMMAEREQNWK